MDASELVKKTIYVVSDTHIGDKSPSDNFEPVRDRFLAFLDYVSADQNGVLILNGDTFEFWQSSLADVIYNNYDLLMRLVESKAVFIAGNHDCDLLSLSKIPNRTPNSNEFWGKVHNNIDLQYGSRTIRIMHGHEFDPFNAPGRASFAGKIIALVTAGIECAAPGSGIEGWMQRVVEPIARFMVITVSSIYDALFTKSKSARERMDQVIDQYHTDNPGVMMVCGHVHTPGWWNDYYVNSGAWVQGCDPHYVKIEPSGDVKLFSWPSNEIDNNQMNLYGYMSDDFIKSIWLNKK